MQEERATRTASWNLYDSRGWDNVVGGDGWSVAGAAEKQAAAQKAAQEKQAGGGGGGFELPSFELPSLSFPAPAPAPAQYSAPAPAPSQGSDGGNPFAFLTELFNPTTTTTTTTPPPSPLESFLQNFGLR